MKGTPLKLLQFIAKLDQDKIYEIKEYKQSRTLNQNSYYWKLLNELSRKVRIPSEELHFELLKKSVPFTEYLVLAEADLRAIEYYEIKGQIEKNDNVYNIVRVYVGSSKLDTVEMGILLDNLIEECKLQGIETMSETELARIRSLERE